MRITYELIVLGMFVAAAVLSTHAIGTLQTSNAQESIRKEFVYCPPVESGLKSSKYLDNSDIRYEINGCPVTRVYVEDWQNVKATDQAKIIADMTKNSFTEVTE